MRPASPKKKVKPLAASKLLVAMTGKASPAKAAEGDAPVFAYIATLPHHNEASPNASMRWRPERCPTSSVR
jgi:hypothetical protein